MTPRGCNAALQFGFAAVENEEVMLAFTAVAASVWTVWLWTTGLRACHFARTCSR